MLSPIQVSTIDQIQRVSCAVSRVYPHVLIALFHGGAKSSRPTPCPVGGPKTIGQTSRKILSENPYGTFCLKIPTEKNYYRNPHWKYFKKSVLKFLRKTFRISTTSKQNWTSTQKVRWPKFRFGIMITLSIFSFRA